MKTLSDNYCKAVNHCKALMLKGGHPLIVFALPWIWWRFVKQQLAEPNLDRPLTQTETAQLLQLSTGLIADGDLMSKESRDTLIRYGLATRLNGFQTWTEHGSQVLEEMRVIAKVRKFYSEVTVAHPKDVMATVREILSGNG